MNKIIKNFFSFIFNDQGDKNKINEWWKEYDDEVIDIFNWLKKNDRHYKKNMEKNAYELINIHEINNKALLNELIQKDNLSLDYFENIKLEGHQYIVNVKGTVDVHSKKITKIPFQFYHVEGDFLCSYNRLTSLKGCPQVIGGGFYCQGNQLTSLEYCPQSIGGNFYCSNNKLKSLKHVPQSIRGDFYFAYNQLISLEYFPEIVTKGVYLYLNTQLLKYKSQSNDPNIQNMSDDDFLDERNFSFWKQFHFIEKANKDNKKILDDLILNNKIENAHPIKINRKKV